jgi:hypothetical protein
VFLKENLKSERYGAALLVAYTSRSHSLSVWGNQLLISNAERRILLIGTLKNKE